MKINFSKAINATKLGPPDVKLNHIKWLTVLITLCGYVLNEFFGYWTIFLGSLLLPTDPTVFSNFPGILLYLLFIILFIISSILTISSLALPWGYVLETINLEVSNSPFILTTWSGNYKRFFIRGFLVQLILLIYFAVLIVLPISIFMGITALIVYIFKFSTEQMQHSFVPYILLALLICGFIALLIILPASIVNYAVKDSFKSGFEILFFCKFIFKNILEYVVVYLFAILLFILFVIAIIALSCTCIGVLFIPYVHYFVISIILFNLFAQMYKKSLEN